MEPQQRDQARQAGSELEKGGRPGRAPRWWRRLALAVAILIVGVALAATARLIGAARPAAELPLAGRVAILPFLDATPDRSSGWVEIGLMEMVAESVSRTAGGAVVSPARLRQALDPRGFDLSDPAARERARQLALTVGADQVLDVTVRRAGDGGYAMEIELFDAGGAAGSGRVTRPDLLAAADALAFSLARDLSSDAEPYRLERQFSRSPFLDRLYATGLAELRTSPGKASAAETARPYFEIALRHRPGFFQAKARLVECLGSLGEIDAAVELTGDLIREAQSRGDRALEARSLRTLASLEALRGRLETAAQLFEQAYAVHIETADRPAQAEALYEMARVALAEGDAARAEELYVEMLGIQQELGDRLGEADTLYQIGSLLLAGGDHEGAEQLLGDARRLALETGDVWTEMRVVASLGEVAQRKGELESAKLLWRKALAFYDQRRENPRRLLLSYNLAQLLVRTGDLENAEDRLQDMRELAVELGDLSYEAKASLGLAWIMLRTGYPKQAKPHLDRALELDQQLDDRKLLQTVIAWYAYEVGNYRLAIQTQAGIKRHSADLWFAVDEVFLRVYREAEILSRRLPLPGEAGYVDPAASPG